MIRNLNRLNFKDYGHVLTEKSSDSVPPEKIKSFTPLELTQNDLRVYLANTEVWLNYGTGMTVLSVSNNAEDFQHYYLDKPVCIQPGIYFCLSPFRQETSGAAIFSETPPSAIEHTLQIEDLLLQNRLKVTEVYTFFYHEKEKGFFFPGEAHPMLELTYVDHGTLHSVVEGQDIVLNQGELMFYGANQWHMQYADIDVAPRYVTISFALEGCAADALVGRKFHISQKSAILLQQLLAEHERMDAYSSDMIISLLSMLLLSLLRHEAAPVAKLQPSNSIHSENEIIRRAQQYISSHLQQKLSVPLVAKMADVSPSYLTALFHKNLQISPGEYIRRIKLQESKRMIREDNMNFTEIAQMLQYSTVHHFSRQFKEKFGITPTEYAKSVR